MNANDSLKAGDKCPHCSGDFAIDPTQAPERLIDHRKRNAASPAVAARYAEQVQEKAERFGVIHKCSGCGYRSRFAPAEQPAGERK